MEHSPEPWRIEEQLAHKPHPGGFGIYGKDGNDAVVLDDRGEVQRADFRRIVACVNACAGIPLSVLERLPTGGLERGIAVMMAKLDTGTEPRPSSVE